MGYLATVVITSIATALCWSASRYLDHSSLVMFYLLSIVYIATRFGRGPSILASFLSVAAFDYFCVHPKYSFLIGDWQFIITFTVMLTIAILISTLTAELQDQAELGRLREKRSEAMRKFSTELSLTRGRDRIVEVAIRHVRTMFDAMVGIYLLDSDNKINEYTADKGLEKLERPENELASWVFQHGEICGLGRGAYPQANSLYLPLIAGQGVLGVLQVSPRGETRGLSDDMELLENFVNHTALAMEVATLSETAQKATIQVEREQLRNALLSSVSHDLRTPLATITGASSSLAESSTSLSESQKTELAQVILEESEHLNSLVRNLLDMTRLESGTLKVQKSWYSIEELVGACLTRMERYLQKRQLNILLPQDLPLVPLDEILMQQVLLNLLENAVRYTPPESPIDIEASQGEDADGKYVLLKVGDRGPGIIIGEEQNIFTKFYRSANAANAQMGVGLGLAICYAISRIHGGSITVSNREGGGAQFTVRLPLDGEAPAFLLEDESIFPGDSLSAPRIVADAAEEKASAENAPKQSGQSAEILLDGESSKPTSELPRQNSAEQGGTTDEV